MIRIALLALAVFFCLSACSPTPTSTDAGAVLAATPDGGPAAPVVVDPAPPAPPAAGSDGGTTVVMPEAKVQLGTAPAAPTTPADVKPATIAPMAP
jgi:hypothetical protein